VAEATGSLSLHSFVGHDAVRSSLALASERGSLPVSLLIHGPKGVGKQRLALWLGQLLLCTDQTAAGPCGQCKACRLALSLEHPDLHWYFPLPRPPRVRPDKLAQALEEARHEVLAERRENPLAASVRSTEPTGLYLAVAQHLRKQAQKRPAMGTHQIFIIGDAETLVPQESSQAAANALLKLLEEPPAGTVLILTSSEPGRLLATIRSRTMPLHLPGLPASEVAGFLHHSSGVDAQTAQRAAQLGRGSIGRALGFLPSGDDPGPLEQLRQQAFRFLKVAAAPDSGAAYCHALEFQSVRGRGLIALLDLVEDALRDLSATAAGATDQVISIDTTDFLERIRAERDIHPVAIAEAFLRLEEAKEMAAGNVNPQLVVAGLLTGIREALNGTVR
jgi:DNA polymerase-3 subunit delta'